MRQRERIEWSEVWITGADDDSLPRVLLVGDSIVQSYFPQVSKTLEGECLCARLATSASVCDPSFRKELRVILDDYRFALIHFNNGLHGWGYDEGTYQKNLDRTMRFLRKRAKGGILVWASTTPVRTPNHPERLDPLTERVVERNHIGARCAHDNDMPVDDLFDLVKDHPEYSANDGMHFSEEGQAVLGQQVARCIRGHLAARL